jgi:RNA polymerase sigma-70 factor (ECF subfamily)
VPGLDYLEVGSEDPSPERQVIDRDELSRLAEMIARLPGKIRDVFTLRRVHGLSQREVAAKLGLSESTVEKHMARGFLIMSEFYGHGGNTPSRPSKPGSNPSKAKMDPKGA